MASSSSSPAARRNTYSSISKYHPSSSSTFNHHQGSPISKYLQSSSSTTNHPVPSIIKYHQSSSTTNHPVPSIIIQYHQSSSTIKHQIPSIIIKDHQSASTFNHPSISHGIKIDVTREPGDSPPPALRRCDTCSTMLVLAITTGSSYPARGTALATRRYASAPRCYDSSTRSRPMRRMHRICIRWQRRRASSCPTSAPWHRRMTCCCRTSVA